jgi:hypothetical protein
VEPSGVTARQSTDFLAVDDALVASALQAMSQMAISETGMGRL